MSNRYRIKYYFEKFCRRASTHIIFTTNNIKSLFILQPLCYDIRVGLGFSLIQQNQPNKFKQIWWNGRHASLRDLWEYPVLVQIQLSAPNRGNSLFFVAVTGVCSAYLLQTAVAFELYSFVAMEHKFSSKRNIWLSPHRQITDYLHQAETSVSFLFVIGKCI